MPGGNLDDLLLEDPKEDGHKLTDDLTVPVGWKEPVFTKDDNPSGLLEKSSFSTLFPKYREKYLRECWPLVQKRLEPFGIRATLDLLKGSLLVETTRKTWDPYAILRGRDFIKLLSRSVPYEQATKIMDDEMYCDVIKIGGMVRNKARFIKRRQRIVGAEGTHLKAIELLTGCYVLVQGSTVSVMGPHKGLQHCRKIVEDCMKNIHPIYNIKRLMIQNELMKDPNMANESWDRFVPNFKSKTLSKRKKPFKVKQKKEYNPFPPEQPKRKEDVEIETGEWFLMEKERKQLKRKAKLETQTEVVTQKKAKKLKSFQPPKEKEYKPATDANKTEGEKKPKIDVEALKKKFAKNKPKKSSAKEV